MTTHLLFHRRAMQQDPPPSSIAWHTRWLARWLLGVLCLVALLSAGVQAQTIQTVAGSGLGPDGAPAASVAINNPTATVMDSAGNLYIADTGNHRIRKVDAASGTISTVAGNGTPGFGGDNGPATSAQLAHPRSVALDSAGNLYIADYYNHRIRKVNTTSGTISTVAGNGSQGFSGDGATATSAQLNFPHGVALDSAGHLYIADTNNNRIRKVNASGTISTVAGDGTPSFGGDNGPATSAQLRSPIGVALDSTGNFYITDYGNHRIRKVNTASGTIFTVAGDGNPGFGGDNGPATSAQLRSPIGVALDSAGHLYIADTNNNRIRKVNTTSGTISTVAGDGSQGFSDGNGQATSAPLNSPIGVALDSTGHLYIADYGNHRIRKVDASGTISTVAGNGSPSFGGDNGPATSAQLNFPRGVALDSAGHLYIADDYNHRIRKVNVSGAISTVAGNGSQGFSGDGATATSTQLAFPRSVALDSLGNLYIADTNNHRIRKVDASGAISTVAGDGTPNFGGDNGPATSAQLNSPIGVALDSAGHLYIADYDNHRIRKVDAASGTISTVAGSGTQGFSGDNGPATSAQLRSPSGMALDSAGHLYIADQSNHRIRKVDAASGTISTVAGRGTQGFSGDNGPATSAQLRSPSGVALDSMGHLYFADYGNHRIRKVDAASGTISTVAGNGTPGFGGDNGPATSAQLSYPQGVALDSAGHLYIADQSNHRIRKVVPAAPGVPTAVTATAGAVAVAVSWAAPSSDGGSAITGYTVTGSPGGSCTATPPTTACTISGLTNGQTYTFTVTASNAQGTSTPSSPASATPAAPAQTLPLPGGAGNASVLISGGALGCTVASGMAFNTNLPAGYPAGATAPLGALAFTATGCTGATLTVRITYPAGSLAGLTPHKYGPPAAGAASSWFAHGTVSGDTVTYQVTDNGPGDSNTTTPGVIEDPFAPLLLAAPPVPGPASAQAIPTLGEWGLVLLSLLAAALGIGTLRRRGAPGV